MSAERDSEAIQRKVEAFRAQLHGAQLQGLFNYLPGVYFVIKNCDGEVMMANEVALRLCGFDCESEMLGKTDYDIFPRDRADVYVADDLQVFETGRAIIEQVEMAPDPADAINWFVTTKIPLYSADGAVVGLACMARDMTDAYEKLRPYTELNDVLEYVRRNYSEPIKVDDLARRANVSPSQFERRFRKVFNITPVQHITQVRIRAACNLLSSTNDTIAAIAVDVGFYDHSHFSRAFKKIMGVTPRAYREQG